MTDTDDYPEPCGECNGDGYVPCWNCGGDGHTDFGGEFEDEEEDCDECAGEGTVWCDNCDGSGDEPDEDDVEPVPRTG